MADREQRNIIVRDPFFVDLSEGLPAFLRVLTIRGEKKSEWRRTVERSFGALSRTFTLPSDADPEQAQAAFKDGVLTVSISKTADKKPRTVDVKAA